MIKIANDDVKNDILEYTYLLDCLIRFGKIIANNLTSVYPWKF